MVLLLLLFCFFPIFRSLSAVAALILSSLVFVLRHGKMSMFFQRFHKVWEKRNQTLWANLIGFIPNTEKNC